MATWFNLWTRRWRNPQGVDVAATTHPPCSYNNNNNNIFEFQFMKNWQYIANQPIPASEEDKQNLD